MINFKRIALVLSAAASVAHAQQQNTAIDDKKLDALFPGTSSSTASAAKLVALEGHICRGYFQPIGDAGGGRPGAIQTAVHGNTLDVWFQFDNWFKTNYRHAIMPNSAKHSGIALVTTGTGYRFNTSQHQRPNWQDATLTRNGSFYDVNFQTERGGRYYGTIDFCE